MAFIYADKDHRGDPKIQLVEGRYEVVSANFASFKRQRAAEEFCNRLNSPFKGEAQAMSEQVNLLRTYKKWLRSEDEKRREVEARSKFLDLLEGDIRNNPESIAPIPRDLIDRISRIKAAALSAHNKQEGE